MLIDGKEANWEIIEVEYHEAPEPDEFTLLCTFPVEPVIIPVKTGMKCVQFAKTNEIRLAVVNNPDDDKGVVEVGICQSDIVVAVLYRDGGNFKDVTLEKSDLARLKDFYNSYPNPIEKIQ